MKVLFSNSVLFLAILAVVFASLFEVGTCYADCEGDPPGSMPVPTGLSNPSDGTFGEPFTPSWDHVWTGCGGYEFQYRRAGFDEWVTVNAPSGSTVDVTIRRPDGSIFDPTSYELRVRSYWGSGCDERVYSEFSVSSNIEVHCPPPVATTDKSWGQIKSLYR